MCVWFHYQMPKECFELSFPESDVSGMFWSKFSWIKIHKELLQLNQCNLSKDLFGYTPVLPVITMQPRCVLLWHHEPLPLLELQKVMSGSTEGRACSSTDRCLKTCYRDKRKTLVRRHSLNLLICYMYKKWVVQLRKEHAVQQTGVWRLARDKRKTLKLFGGIPWTFWYVTCIMLRWPKYAHKSYICVN